MEVIILIDRISYQLTAPKSNEVLDNTFQINIEKKIKSLLLNNEFNVMPPAEIVDLRSGYLYLRA